MKYDLVTITVNYNNAQLTIDCVNSVLNSVYKNFAVLIVDNGSTKEDLMVIKKSYNQDNVVIATIEKNIGYVGGINQGLKEALKYSPNYFLIMNNDTIFDKMTIQALVETSKEYGDRAIVSGKVYNMDEPDTLQYIGQKCVNANKFQYIPYVKNMREKDNGQYDRVMEMGMLDDTFWLLPRIIFDNVGYYSTYFYLYGEQNDYAMRAIKKGFKLVYTPKAKIWHYLHMTTSSGVLISPKVVYWQSYSTMILAWLHLPWYYFLRLYFKYSIRLLIDYLNNILKYHNKENFIIKPKLTGVFYFTKWLFNRKPNTGFNPYN